MKCENIRSEKMRRSLIFIFVLFIMIFSLSCDSKPEDGGADGGDTDGNTNGIEWLMMMYIGGDGNLEEALWEDLNEVELGLHKLDEGVRNRIEVVALWDGIEGYTDASPEGTKLYELGTDRELNTRVSSNTKDLTESKWWTGDEVDMSDGATLTAFMDWAKERYPNPTKTMLVLSDHGGGPRNKDGKPPRGAIWDDTTGGSECFLETKELSKAISDAGFGGENKMSLLGFDVCLMASVEEFYEHRNVVEYCVASLQTEQADGWEYEDWIPQITKGMTPAELGTVIVKSYHDSFSGDPEMSDQTLSCTDLSKMDNLKTAIDALGKAITDNDLIGTAKGYFDSSTLFTGSWSYLHEVGDFASKLSSTAVSAEASAVANAMKEAIVYSWANSGKGNYYGAGSVTGRGLHLMGQMNYSNGTEFNYDTSIFSFADGDWADLYDIWF